LRISSAGLSISSSLSLKMMRRRSAWWEILALSSGGGGLALPGPLGRAERTRSAKPWTKESSSAEKRPAKASASSPRLPERAGQSLEASFAAASPERERSSRKVEIALVLIAAIDSAAMSMLPTEAQGLSLASG
jgi:hypothetical protein